jgi:hypothetical protein
MNSLSNVQMPVRGRQRHPRGSREANRLRVAQYRDRWKNWDPDRGQPFRFQNLLLAQDPRILPQLPQAAGDDLGPLDELREALDAIPIDREQPESPPPPNNTSGQVISTTYEPSYGLDMPTYQDIDNDVEDAEHSDRSSVNHHIDNNYYLNDGLDNDINDDTFNQNQDILHADDSVDDTIIQPDHNVQNSESQQPSPGKVYQESHDAVINSLTHHLSSRRINQHHTRTPTTTGSQYSSSPSAIMERQRSRSRTQLERCEP